MILRHLLLLVTVATPARLPAQWLDSARTRLAQVEGEIRVAGLDSAVEVRRDRWGVPHIYARTVRDLFFAQGFVAAQDRLWQIDMWRRIGEGRVSEVLGPEYLERDRFARLLKYRGDMEAEWASYAPDTRLIVTAFVAGLNAWVRVARERPPIEYSLLGFLPEPFADDVPLQRMAALAMTGNATSEIERAAAVTILGRARAERLFPLDPLRPLDPAPGVDLSALSAHSLGATYDAYRNLNYSRIDGSNNWVVSGSHTATGKPLLANDPHRAITTPSLRYLTHLVGPGWNVIGAGEPAVPGVAGGHNQRIGFGFTIVGMDQQDVYVERLGRCPTGSTRRCYLTGTGWRPVRTQVDTIPVKGHPARMVQLEFTEHGPIVAEDSTGRGFVIKFVGAEPGTAGYLAQISINRATDWESFKAATARWKLPTENLVYADVDGNIGWVGAGLMPIRSWTGMLPVPGDGRYEWQGFLPFADLPMSFNPPSGVIATANHNILPPGYTKPLSYEWAEPSRFNRIVEVLTGRKGWTRQDFERLQHDELSIPARELVPLLLAAGQRQGTKGAAWEQMTEWDYVMRKEAAAPLLFAAWLDSLSSGGFALAAGAEARALGRAGVTSLELPVLVRLVKEPGRDSLLVGSFEAAAAALRDRFGDDPAHWRWGAVHRASFRHPLVRALDLPEASRGGHWTTVHMTGGPNLRQAYGASFREILDFADWDNSVATSVPGQSGQPGSPFYGNLRPLWERGEYFPLVYSRAAVERNTVHVLILTPGQE
ncbi:MAG TPA: penicillin acylase family protein [Gemmatimonadales bacterium]